MISDKNRSLRRAGMALAAGMAVGIPMTAGAVVAEGNTTLQISGIQGDGLTGAGDTKESINVLAWSWGASNPSLPGGPTGKANVAAVSLTKSFGFSSPSLFRAVVTGQKFSQATINVYSTVTGTRTLQWLITLTTVSVSSQQASGSGSSNALTENITLQYQQIRITDVPTGQTDCFNVVTNTTC